MTLFLLQQRLQIMFCITVYLQNMPHALKNTLFLCIFLVYVVDHLKTMKLLYMGADHMSLTCAAECNFNPDDVITLISFCLIGKKGGPITSRRSWGSGRFLRPPLVNEHGFVMVALISSPSPLCLRRVQRVAATHSLHLCLCSWLSRLVPVVLPWP